MNYDNPSRIAREALRELTSKRLPPTPENYRAAYRAIAAPDGKFPPEPSAAMLFELADELRDPEMTEGDAAKLRLAVAAEDWPQVKLLLKRICKPAALPAAAQTATWGPLIRDLFAQWERRAAGLTQARKREALEHVLLTFGGSSDGLYARLRGLTRGWADAAAVAPAPLTLITSGQPVPEVPGPPGPRFITDEGTGATSPAEPGLSTAPLWAEMLAQTMVVGVVSQLFGIADLRQECGRLAQAVRATPHDNADETRRMEEALRHFWVQLEINGADQQEVLHGLLRVLHLLTANMAELIGDGSWMRGQLEAVAALTQGTVSVQTLGALEQGLRECTFQQGVLKPALDQAKDAMKAMVSLFLDRLNELATETGGYHDRLSQYAVEIEKADDISQLSELVVEMIDDTRGLQDEVAKSRTEIVQARQMIDEHQQRARRLEAELAALSDRLHEDYLTATLNRRGLARAFEAEASRTDRHERALSLAVLDVDNFKQVNDRLGHQVGDLALVHLARTIRQSIRPSDVIARFGGEEFVILLPETVGADAVKVMMRAQRELTKRFFLHRNERLLITFSAGVAERKPGESQEALIARADAALYRAKQAGKNRVWAAEEELPADAPSHLALGTTPVAPAPARIA